MDMTGHTDGGESLKRFVCRFARLAANEPPNVVSGLAGRLSYRLAAELEGTPIGEAVKAARGGGSRFAVFFDPRPKSWRFKLQRTPGIVQAFERASELEAVRAVMLLDSLAMDELAGVLESEGGPAPYCEQTAALVDWCRAFDGTQCDGPRVLGAVADFIIGRFEDPAAPETTFAARAAAFTLLSCRRTMLGHARAVLEAARCL